VANRGGSCSRIETARELFYEGSEFLKISKVLRRERFNLAAVTTLRAQNYTRKLP
jgi:hypothetical protein